MGKHEHGAVELPGGPTDPEGRAVNEQLLSALVSAALNGCGECVDRYLDEVAADPASVARLVTFSRLAALHVYHGELPGFMTDDADTFGPSVPELRRLVRAVTAAEPLTEVCEQMTPAERRAAARPAVELLVGHLSLAADLDQEDAETLAEVCCSVSALMIDWWFKTAPMAAREFSETWDRYAFGRREAGLTGNGVEAVALLLGAVLHHQALEDGVSAETFKDLAFSRALPALKDPELAGTVLTAFVAPPEADAITVPVKRLARRDSDFLADLSRMARHVVSAHAANCPYGMRQAGHACTIEHRFSALRTGTQAQVSEPGAEEGRRVVLPRIGYSEDEPVEGAPEGHPDDHTWQINAGVILLERLDADTVRWNENISEDSSISGLPPYQHETGLEALACPACDNQENFLAEGRWGDPITLHCRCGVTVMSAHDAPPHDLGRRLLKRLILCEADPAYAARRLMPQLVMHQERERTDRTFRTYLGPDAEDVALVEAIDLAQVDLAGALVEALQPKLPKRHGGRPLTLLLLNVAHALSAPAVKNSEDGRRLAESVRAFVSDLKEESDRWAPSRQPVLDRLQAWQDGGGPPAWQAAWARMMEVAGHRFKGYQVGNGRLRDGCAALALALYLLAREGDTGVERIGKDEVLALMPSATADGTTEPGNVPRLWAARLEAVGHDVNAADDPVARMWQHLSTEVLIDPYREQHEPALTAGLQTVLGPRSVYSIRF